MSIVSRAGLAAARLSTADQVIERVPPEAVSVAQAPDQGPLTFAGAGNEAVMRLSHGDFDRLQRVILELHDQPRPEPFKQAVPGLFLKLIPADWFVLMDAEVDMPKKRLTMFDCWESCRIINDDLVRRMERVTFSGAASTKKTTTRT